MAGVGAVVGDDGRVVGDEERRVGEMAPGADVVGSTDVVVPSAAAMTGCTVVAGAPVVTDA
jgi:hypothetical protein